MGCTHIGRLSVVWDSISCVKDKIAKIMEAGPNIIQPVLSEHLRDGKKCLLKTSACFIQILFNVFAFCWN